MDGCMGLVQLFRLIYNVLKIFWILIPIGLIIYGTIDLGKAVIASDEKEVKAAQTRLIKRFIYAALVFFIPMFVTIVMNLVSAQVGDSNDPNSTDTESWADCWTQIKG